MIKGVQESRVQQVQLVRRAIKGLPESQEPLAPQARRASRDLRVLQEPLGRRVIRVRQVPREIRGARESPDQLDLKEIRDHPGSLVRPDRQVLRVTKEVRE